MLISHASIRHVLIVTSRSAIGFFCLASAHAFGMTGDGDSPSASPSSSKYSRQAPTGAPPRTEDQPEAEHKVARQLSEEFKLNTEESVVSEFRQLTMAIREKLGEQAWLAIQALALKALEERNFEHFDPLVKDVSCELRALFGVYVAQRINSAGGLTQDELDLSTLIYILSHALIAEYGQDGFGVADRNSWTFLVDFLDSIGIKFSPLPSRNQIDKLILTLERAVSYGSVMFARRLADELDSDIGRALKSLFLKQCIFDDQYHRRPVLSLFGVSRLWLEFSRLHRVPLVVRTRLSTGTTNEPSSGIVVTSYQHDGRKFVALDPSLLETDTPVLVADTVTTRFDLDREHPPADEDIQRYISELDFETATLSGGAAHFQFAGDNRDAQLTVSPGCEAILSPFVEVELVKTAGTIGTSNTNRSMQLVERAYVTTLGQALQYAGRTGSHDRFPVLLGNAFYYPEQAPSQSSISEQVTLNAEELCLEYGLGREDTVEDGFRKRADAVREWLGHNVWSEIRYKALSAIGERHFTHFDPLVKDTSCELRALFGIHVAQKNVLGIPLEDYEIDLVTLIYILSHALTTNYGNDGFGDGDKNQSEQLHEFLLSDEVRSDVSRSMAKRLMNELERVVAYGSVMFARRFAATLENETGRALYALFLKQCIFDDPKRGRPVLPCFGISVLGLEIVHKWKVPFVIRTRFSVKPTEAPSSGIVVAVYEYDGSKFIALDPAAISIDTPVIAVDAVATQFGLGYRPPPSADEVHRYIDKLNLVEAWLSGAAIHPQFAGTNAEVKLVCSSACKLIVDQWNRLISVAKRKGISKANRRTQFAVHTYATTWGQARQYAGRMEIADRAEDLTGPSKLPVPLRNALYYPTGLIKNERTVLRLQEPDTGSARYFQEHEVDGSQGDCGFTAIGTSRDEAIRKLVENANNPETKRLLAPEIRELILNDIAWDEAASAHPPVELFELRQDHNELNRLHGDLLSEQIQVNNELQLEGDAQYNFDQVREYLREQESAWAETFANNLQRYQELAQEMEDFRPTAEQLIAFVQYEFGTRRAYLSYFRNGGGTLAALARLRGIGVTVFTGDRNLTPTLHVPAAPGNAERYFLHHVGGRDGQGRQFLNHFNILEEIDAEDANGVLPIQAAYTNSTQPASSSSSTQLTKFLGVTSSAFKK